MSEDVHVPPTATKRFEAFLEAADRVALEMLLTEGISPFTDTDRNDYYSGVEALAKQHGEPYQEVSGLDDVVTLQEMAAKVDAAHMVGLALGLRLAGRHGLGGCAMTTTQQLDATAIARECIAQYLSTDHVLNENSEVFGDVLTAVRAKRGGLSLEEREAVLDRLRLAVPEDLRAELNRLDDVNSDDLCAAERAGYLIGFEMAEAMRGGGWPMTKQKRPVRTFQIGFQSMLEGRSSTISKSAKPPIGLTIKPTAFRRS